MKWKTLGFATAL